jgi:hypothetical protein
MARSTSSRCFEKRLDLIIPPDRWTHIALEIVLVHQVYQVHQVPSARGDSRTTHSVSAAATSTSTGAHAPACG